MLGRCRGSGREDVSSRTRCDGLRASDTQIDWTAVRMDTFCGRLMQSTTYRLSLFVPNVVPDPGQDC